MTGWPTWTCGTTCAASLAFTLPLVSTHIAEEIAFPEADGAGYVEGCWATHQLATSMDYSPESRLANWVLGAVNTHAAHHLFPDVCGNVGDVRCGLSRSVENQCNTHRKHRRQLAHDTISRAQGT